MLEELAIQLLEDNRSDDRITSNLKISIKLPIGEECNIILDYDDIDNLIADIGTRLAHVRSILINKL